MPAPAFCKLIDKEQRRIMDRCNEIDETMRALDDERKAFEERNDALEAVQTLYQRSQENLDDALAIQSRLSVIDQGIVAVEHDGAYREATM